MVLTPFSREHFEEYASWYEDPKLNEALGPMDEEWLDYVCSDEEGVQYAAIENECLVGVIGVALPSVPSMPYVITDIAINPTLCRRGIGSRLLKELFQLPRLSQAQYWIAYIDKMNLSAQYFFTKNAWSATDAPIINGMIEYHKN